MFPGTLIHYITNRVGWVTAQRQPVSRRGAGALCRGLWAGGAESEMALHLPVSSHQVRDLQCGVLVCGRLAHMEVAVATQCAMESPSEYLPLKISLENT